jgi:hypothetical protein
MKQMEEEREAKINEAVEAKVQAEVQAAAALAHQAGQTEVDRARKDAEAAVMEAQDAAKAEALKMERTARAAVGIARQEAKEKIARIQAGKDELKADYKGLEADYKGLKIACAKNEELFDYWRPRIHQHGYDLFRARVLAGTPLVDIPLKSEVPLGWWGDSEECLPGQIFDDFPPEAPAVAVTTEVQEEPRNEAADGAQV